MRRREELLVTCATDMGWHTNTSPSECLLRCYMVVSAGTLILHQLILPPVSLS